MGILKQSVILQGRDDRKVDKIWHPLTNITIHRCSDWAYPPIPNGIRKNTWKLWGKWQNKG